MDYIFSIVIGFIIGLIPNYYLDARISVLLKFKNNWTQKTTSVLLDIIKGMLIILITKYLLNYEFTSIILSLIIGALTHSFLQGLKLKSRNGQFVALGGLSIFLPALVLFWIIIWVISFIYKKNINFSLISATFLTGLVAITSSEILNKEYWYSNPTADSDAEFAILVGILFAALVLTQIDNFKSFILTEKLKDN